MSHAGVRWTLPLFEKPPDAVDRAQKEDRQLFILPQRRISFSGFHTLVRCPRQFFLGGPGTWNGWFNDAPVPVREAYSHKRIEGVYAHYGRRVHEFAAQVDFNDVDTAFPERGGRAISEDRLWERLEHRFYQDWCESASMTIERYKQRRAKNSVFFFEHFSGAYRPQEDQKNQTRLWNWVRKAALGYLERRHAIRERIPISGWKVIEGQNLVDGLVLRKAEDLRPERVLRSEAAYPSAVIEVAGETWEYGYTIDRLYFEAQGKIFYLVDLKTGKQKERDQEQLRNYGALLIRANPEISHENLVLRLAYLSADPDKIIQDDRFESPKDVELSLENVRRQCREYWSRLTPIESVTVGQLLELFPQSKVVGSDGKPLKENFPAGTVVALRDNFPPSAAQWRDLDACRLCEKRPLCDEGTTLINLQWKPQ